MGSLILRRGSRSQPTLEEMRELAKLELEKLQNMPDEDEGIDFSDIPPTTKEELAKFYPVNPRTPEQWERYYRNCPPHIQQRHEKIRKLHGSII